MDQDRCSNLSILSIEKYVEIDPETILEQFKSINKKKKNECKLKQHVNNYFMIHINIIKK